MCINAPYSSVHLSGRLDTYVPSDTVNMWWPIERDVYAGVLLYHTRSNCLLVPSTLKHSSFPQHSVSGICRTMTLINACCDRTCLSSSSKCRVE